MSPVLNLGPNLSAAFLTLCGSSVAVLQDCVHQQLLNWGMKPAGERAAGRRYWSCILCLHPGRRVMLCRVTQHSTGSRVCACPGTGNKPRWGELPAENGHICTGKSKINVGLVQFLKEMKKLYCTHCCSSLQKQEMRVSVSKNRVSTFVFLRARFLNLLLFLEGVPLPSWHLAEAWCVATFPRYAVRVHWALLRKTWQLLRN